jgi:hypothetical protein
MLSTNAQYVTLQTYFPHPSFTTLPIKLKLGLQVGGEITNNNPLGPINQKKKGAVEKYDLTLFIRLCSQITDPAVGPGQKLVTNSFGNRNFMQPMGRLSMRS